MIRCRPASGGSEWVGGSETVPSHNGVGRIRIGRIEDSSGRGIVESPRVLRVSPRASPFGFSGGFPYLRLSLPFRPAPGALEGELQRPALVLASSGGSMGAHDTRKPRSCDSGPPWQQRARACPPARRREPPCTRCPPRIVTTSKRSAGRALLRIFHRGASAAIRQSQGAKGSRKDRHASPPACSADAAMALGHGAPGQASRWPPGNGRGLHATNVCLQRRAPVPPRPAWLLEIEQSGSPDRTSNSRRAVAKSRWPRTVSVTGLPSTIPDCCVTLASRLAG